VTVRFDLNSFAVEIRANRPIEQGEELTRSYFSSLDTLLLPQAERLKILKAHYYFTQCACETCTQPPHSLEISDSIRTQLNEKKLRVSNAELGAWMLSPELPDDLYIKPFVQYISLLREEGLHALIPRAIELLQTSYEALADEANMAKYRKLSVIYRLLKHGEMKVVVEKDLLETETGGFKPVPVLLDGKVQLVKSEYVPMDLEKPKVVWGFRNKERGDEDKAFWSEVFQDGVFNLDISDAIKPA
jgi:hypothetical protein